MFAKIIGVVTAIIVFFLYFKWRGADPVLETMVGILLSLLVGAWAWRATGRKQIRFQGNDDKPADKGSPPS